MSKKKVKQKTTKKLYSVMYVCNTCAAKGNCKRYKGNNKTFKVNNIYLIKILVECQNFKGKGKQLKLKVNNE